MPAARLATAGLPAPRVGIGAPADARTSFTIASGTRNKRKRTLLSHFGSLKRIRAATADDIALVEGFNAQLAERVHKFLTTETKAAEAEAREAAQGGADLDGGAPPEAGPGDGALLHDREDVAFDAAAAELEALEEDAIEAEPEQ